MVKSEKLRGEIDNKYKWDLESLYATNDAWELEYQEVDKKIEELSKYKNHILESASNLLEVTKLNLELDRKVTKLYVYAAMRSDEETFNTYYQTLKGKVKFSKEDIPDNTKVVLEILFNVSESPLIQNKHICEFEFDLSKYK